MYDNKGQMDESDTQPVKRKAGRPKGSKNKPKFYDIKVADTLALTQIKARAGIDATKHMRRMSELAESLAERHKDGGWLRRDEATSIGLELKVLQALTAKVLPDLALVRTEAPRDDERMMHGVVVLPELENTGSMVGSQRTSNGNGRPQKK